MNYIEQLNVFASIAKEQNLKLFDIIIANEVSNQFEDVENIDLNEVCSIVDDMYLHCDTITSLENVVQAVRACIVDDGMKLSDITRDNITSNLVW